MTTLRLAANTRVICLRATSWLIGLGNSAVAPASSPTYGQPLQNTNVAYQPRMAHFGFRVAF